MSIQTLHSNNADFSALSLNQLLKTQNVLVLSDINHIGKTWDKHRANAELVSRYYATADEHELNHYAWRMKMCAGLLEFQLLPQATEGIFNLKLLQARFCSDCLECQVRSQKKEGR